MNAASLINQTSGICEYYTPPVIIQAARSALGVINLDPASSEKANETVKAERFFSESDDGLTREWRGRVWLNHPFGRGLNALWIDKLFKEWHSARVVEACCITYACTSEKWFKPLLACYQCFLIPRTNYLLPDGSTLKGVTKGSVVTYMGNDPNTFGKAFSNLGVIKMRWNQ